MKKLRRRFIALTMLAIGVTLVLLMACLNLINYQKIYSDANHTLALLERNRGVLPENGKGKTDRGWEGKRNAEETRFFSVTLDQEQTAISVQLGAYQAVFTEETACQYARNAVSSGKQSGQADSFQYSVTAEDTGYRVCFVDLSEKLQSARSFLLASVGVACGGFALLFMAVLLFSNRLLSPMIESYEKQKRFITDASHELKTPLSVILSTAEVLEMETGENKWLSRIKHQAQAMANLTQSLTALAKMEENEDSPKGERFLLSETVQDVAEPFEKLAEERGLRFIKTIQSPVDLQGDEATLRRLLTLLLDNALKYSSGEIRLTVAQRGLRRKIILSNTADPAVIGDISRIFERFYRSDANRASGEGFGIGLSTAKALTEKMHGTISAQQDAQKESLVITLVF